MIKIYLKLHNFLSDMSGRPTDFVKIVGNTITANFCLISTKLGQYMYINSMKLGQYMYINSMKLGQYMCINEI